MKNKGLIIVIILVVLISIFYYKSTTSKDESMDKVEIENVVVDLNNNKLYIIPNMHGITGNHQRIIITEESNSNYKKEVDYAFFTSEIYYKVEDNKLVVYAPASSILEPADNNNLLEYVIIKPLKTADSVSDYDNNYKKYGLKKISVYQS